MSFCVSANCLLFVQNPTRRPLRPTPYWVSPTYLQVPATGGTDIGIDFTEDDTEIDTDDDADADTGTAKYKDTPYWVSPTYLQVPETGGTDIDIDMGTGTDNKTEVDTNNDADTYMILPKIKILILLLLHTGFYLATGGPLQQY